MMDIVEAWMNANELLSKLKSQQVNKWEKALLSLTPGGSEYVGDPDFCVRTVREYQQMQHNQIVKLTKELKAKV